MRLHVLNGDALAERLPGADLPGERIICRECLIEGPLDGDCPTTFWQTRARYLRDTCGEEPERYLAQVAGPLSGLCQLPAETEVNLWFEHDLFCQANLWLTLSLLAVNPHPLQLFLVYPHLDHPGELWNGFGPLDEAGLLRSFNQRLRLAPGDLKLGADLWSAYKNQDLRRLAELSTTRSRAFPYLAAVVQAHVDRFPSDGKPARPERVLAGLINDYGVDFPRVFRAFSRREGVYGFGDTQVRRIFDQLTQNN